MTQIIPINIVQKHRPAKQLCRISRRFFYIKLQVCFDFPSHRCIRFRLLMLRDPAAFFWQHHFRHWPCVSAIGHLEYLTCSFGYVTPVQRKGQESPQSHNAEVGQGRGIVQEPDLSHVCVYKYQCLSHKDTVVCRQIFHHTYIFQEL